MNAARTLVALFEEDARRIEALGRAASSALRVFQAFRQCPMFTVRRVCERTDPSFPAASKGIEHLQRLGIAREVTGHRWDRVSAYRRYVSSLDEGVNP